MPSPPEGGRSGHDVTAAVTRRAQPRTNASKSGGRKRVFRYPFSEYQDRDGEAVYSTSAMGVNAELRNSPGLEIDALLLDELTAYVNAPQGKPKPLPAEWMDSDADGDGFDAQDLAEAQRAFWESRRAGGSRVEWRYVQSDYLGSSVLVTDSAGDPVSTRRHEPYGALAQRIGVQPSRGYTGAGSSRTRSSGSYAWAPATTRPRSAAG